jgi:putative hydrolase of the HAD superfamily
MGLQCVAMMMRFILILSSREPSYNKLNASRARNESCVVFDLDDTLYAERDFVFSGFRAVEASLVAGGAPAGFASKARALFERGLRGNIFDLVLKEMGLMKESLVGELVNVYRSHSPDIFLPNESRDVLEEVGSSCCLALITDGDLITQQNKVRVLVPIELFDVIVCSDAFGRAAWKPSEIPYRRVMEQLSDVDQFVYVGDNPHKDFITARKLGWHSIRVRIRGREHFQVELGAEYEADCCVGSLSLVPGLTRILLGLETHQLVQEGVFMKENPEGGVS